MSKRLLGRLVSEGYVSGWDDPRMLTLSGLRRRGYKARAIQAFCDAIGVSKSNSTIDMAFLEHVVRDDLNKHASRAMAVLRPLRVVITNYPEDRREDFSVPNYPQDRENTETRTVPFTRELYIEQEDFMEDPPGKFFRLAPGREVRLIGAYYITCTDIVKDDAGNVVELRCTYDPLSQGGSTPDKRKVKGTLHWVSAREALQAEVRLYDTLFTIENPTQIEEGGDFTDNINSDSLELLTGCRVEPNLANAKPEDNFQFMRQGYFCVDSVDSSPDHLVFNRTVTLRDTWAKIQKRK